jgi:hypothetical protein
MSENSPRFRIPTASTLRESYLLTCRRVRPKLLEPLINLAFAKSPNSPSRRRFAGLRGRREQVSRDGILAHEMFVNPANAVAKIGGQFALREAVICQESSIARCHIGLLPDKTGGVINRI